MLRTFSKLKSVEKNERRIKHSNRSLNSEGKRTGKPEASKSNLDSEDEHESNPPNIKCRKKKKSNRVWKMSYLDIEEKNNRKYTNSVGMETCMNDLKYYRGFVLSEPPPIQPIQPIQPPTVHISAPNEDYC